MPITKLNNKDATYERQALIGLVMDEDVIKAIAPLCEIEYFTTRASGKIAKWCLDHWDDYELPIGSDIQNVFEEKMDNLTEEEVKFIADFLSELSLEHTQTEHYNSQRVIDNSIMFLKKRSLIVSGEKIVSYANRDKINEAEDELSNFKAIEKLSDQSINPWKDEEEIKGAFETNDERLFEFSGKLGYLINDALVRDGFLALMGPEKRGKSWILMELAKRACLARNNVVFFGAGDMSKKQMIMRWHIGLAGKSNREKYTKEDYLPCLDCLKNQLDTCKKKWRTSSCGLRGAVDARNAPREYVPCMECQDMRGEWDDFESVPWKRKFPKRKVLSKEEAIKNGRAFSQRMVGKDFKMLAYPSDTLTVGKIDHHLDLWEKNDNFIPDVIVIDYADIMAGESKFNETRNVENEKWKRLRRLSMERHCLVITATQTDAASYDLKNITMKNFSEDKRKFAHVTGMLALNQTPDEKKDGIMRLGWVVEREDDYNIYSQASVIQNLTRGRPIVASF